VEKEVDVIVAMTRARCVFVRGFCRVRRGSPRRKPVLAGFIKS
jgi:hypothetical protein